MGKGRIVLIDTKTGKSYTVAYPQIWWQDPNQPHAQFSADGKKVNFTTTRRSVDGQVVYGCAIVDVSSIVEDGQHDVIYAGTDEVIEFKHTAYSREIFAAGAVKAAKFMAGITAPGMYDMSDVLKNI